VQFFLPHSVHALFWLRGGLTTNGRRFDSRS